ncbi:MAG: histidine kinase N-terminal 7TM domain-containing protein, partial [Pseudomonadota bacterium]
MTIETIILTVGVALYLVLAGVLSAGRAQLVHGFAHWLMLALAIWVTGGWLLVNATSPSMLDVALIIIFMGSVLVPVTGLMVVTHVSARPLPLLVSYSLWVIPVASLAIMLNPTWRPMMWSEPVDYLTLAHAFELQRGWWFNWVHLPYAVALYGVAVFLLARHARRQSRRLRLELLALACVALVPLGVGVLRALGIAPWHTVSAATVIAALTPAVAWLVLRHGALFNDSICHQALFDQMTDAVVLVDDHNHVISVNPAAADLFDLDGQHVRGIPLQQTVPTLAALINQSSDDASSEAISLNGRRLALRVSHVRRPGDAQVLRLLTCRDITETYRAEAAVRRNEALFRTLIHHASNAILRLSLVNDQSEYPDFEITVANPQGARLFESSPDLLVGKTLGRQLFGATASDRQYALQKIVPVVREAQVTGRRQDLEFCLSENGAKCWYRLLADPVDKDIGLTFIDISSERRQQDALHSQAMTDALTEVLNRRGFESAATTYLQNASETLNAAL